MFYYRNILLLFIYKIHKLPLKTVSSNNILATLNTFTSAVVDFFAGHEHSVRQFIVKVIN